MLLHIEDYVQIAGRAAIRPRFPFALHAQARSSVHARRNAQFDGSFLLDAPLAAAFGATLFDNLAGALAGWAGARNREESLLISELPTAGARLTRHYAGSRFRAGAITSGTKFLARDFDFCVNASRGFLK